MQVLTDMKVSDEVVDELARLSRLYFETLGNLPLELKERIVGDWAANVHHHLYLFT